MNCAAWWCALVVLAAACRREPSTDSPARARRSVAIQIDDTRTRMVPFGLSGSVLVADRDGVILSKGYGAGLRADTIYPVGGPGPSSARAWFVNRSARRPPRP